MSEPTVAPTRVTTPLSAEDVNALLKLHNAYLIARVTKFEAGENEVKTATAVNEYVKSIKRPDEGNWEVNLAAGTLDPK